MFATLPGFVDVVRFEPPEFLNCRCQARAAACGDAGRARKTRRRRPWARLMISHPLSRSRSGIVDQGPVRRARGRTRRTSARPLYALPPSRGGSLLGLEGFHRRCCDPRAGFRKAADGPPDHNCRAEICPWPLRCRKKNPSTIWRSRSVASWAERRVSLSGGEDASAIARRSRRERQVEHPAPTGETNRALTSLDKGARLKGRLTIRAERAPYDRKIVGVSRSPAARQIRYNERDDLADGPKPVNGAGPGRGNRMGGGAAAALHVWSTRTPRDCGRSTSLHRQRYHDHDGDCLGRCGARAAWALARLRVAHGRHRDRAWRRLHHSQRMAQCPNPAQLVLHRGDAGSSLAWNRPRALAAVAGRSKPGFRHLATPIPPHAPAALTVAKQSLPNLLRMNNLCSNHS